MDKIKETVTFKIIVINIIVFILTLGGTLFSELLGNNYGLTIGQFQIYRLLTNIFYHYGFLHLACNMFSLIQIGGAVEYIYGKKKFLIAYFFTGVVGSLISCIIHQFLGQNVLSAGASGAICGLLGLLIGKLKGNISSKLQTIVLTILPILIIGLQSGVDNVAHWTCFTLGVLITPVLNKMK